MAEVEDKNAGCLGWVCLAFLVVAVVSLIIFILKHFWAVIFLALVVLAIIYAIDFRGIRSRLAGSPGVALLAICILAFVGSTVWMVFDLKSTPRESSPQTDTATSTPASTTPASSATSPSDTEPAPATEPEVTYPAVYGGLNEGQRRQVFYDLAAEQAKYPPEDPRWAQNNEDSYTVIAQRYGVETYVLDMITAEGVDKNWPMPPPAP